MSIKLFYIGQAMAKPKQEGFIGIRVPQRLRDEISTLITQGLHLNEAEFVREAIREKIRASKVELINV